MKVEVIKPFGPIILKSRLPSKIFDQINQYVENNIEDETNFPNLLLRDIKNPYLKKQFCDDIGFTEFVEEMGKEFLSKVSNPLNYSELVLNVKHKNNDSDFENFDDVYAEAWVNRYYSGDYTPLHRHGSILSGIVFLKVPYSLMKEQNNFSDRDKNRIVNVGRLNGRVEFVMNSHYIMSDSVWHPEQEMSTVLLFPSWLSHHTYPFRSNDERRTLSFNLVQE